MWQNMLDIEGFMWEGKPILQGANEECKNLDKTLKEKKIEVQKLKGLLETESDRGKQMHTHHMDLVLEKNFVQQLQNASRHEVDIEDAANKLLSREKSRLLQDIKDVTKEIDKLESRQKSRQAILKEQTEKSEALKAAIHWEEEALLKWLQESAEMERDKVALIKYTHQDNAKIKELSLLLERLAQETKKKKLELDDVNTELFISQSEIDRIQDEFQKAHIERQDIIGNWEKVLQHLQDRNQDIDKISKHMVLIRDEEKKLIQEMIEQKTLLESEIDNNKNTELKATEKENLISKLRMLLNTESNRESDLKAELQTMRNISTNMSYKVQNTRDYIVQLQEQLKHKEKRIKNINITHKNLQDVMDTLQKETFDTDHCIQELDKNVQTEKKQFDDIQRERAALQNSILEFQQKLKQVKAKEKATEALVKAMKVSNRNLLNTITKRDHDRVEQQKLLSGISITIKQTERRIHMMEGELANDEERWQMQSEKGELQKVLDEKNSALNFLTQQVKTMIEKMTLAIKTLSLGKQRNKELLSKIHFLEYYINNSESALKTEKEKKEVLLVDECMAKLQLSCYKDRLQTNSNSVMDLQRDHVQFETVVKQRVLELKTCKNMVQTEVRKEEEECYQTARQLQECLDKAAKIQIRYEVLLNALGLSEIGDNPQVKLLVRAEDERRDLQQEREELIVKVIKIENELQALRNTLWLVQATNKQFRQMLNPPGLTKEETESLRQLETEKQTVDIEMHHSLTELHSLEVDISQTQETIGNLRAQLSQLELSVAEKRISLESLDKELNELQNKLLRAERSSSQTVIAITDKATVENDIKIQLLRELLKSGTTQLFETVTDKLEIFDQIREKFEEAHLSFPTRIRSSLSGRSSWSSLTLSQLLEKGRQSRTVLTPTGSEKQRTVLTPSVVSVGSDMSDKSNKSFTTKKSSKTKPSTK